MISREISNLGVIFSYDPVENILLLTLQQAHVLPSDEARRVWYLIKSYAATHLSHPCLVLEVASTRLIYGPVELIHQHFMVEQNLRDRRCLFLMSQSDNYRSAPGQWSEIRL